MSDLDVDDKGTILDNLVQVAPSVAVSSAVILGLPLSDWVYVVTIVYTFVGICTMIKKHWIDPWLENRKKNKK
nr:MAG TPA: holin [Bacteriophage sp.]